MTKQGAIENHRKMWFWIAKETLKQKKIIRKSEYFRIVNDRIERCLNYCFCCEYAGGLCNICPIDWYGNTATLMCCNKKEYEDGLGLFNLWDKEGNYKKSALLAYKISKLPERNW